MHAQSNYNGAVGWHGFHPGWYSCGAVRVAGNQEATFLNFVIKYMVFCHPIYWKQQVCPDKAIRHMMYVASENRRKEEKKETALIILKVTLLCLLMRGSSVKLLHCQALMHTLESKQRIVSIGYKVILSSKDAILQLR